MCDHPGDAVVAALIRALKDRDQEVRGDAAESLRVIAARRSWRVEAKPLLEALETEPEDSKARHYIMGALRELGAGAAVERMMEQKQKAKIEASGGPKAEKIRQMEELGHRLRGTGAEFETAFENLFLDLRDEDADIRAEAARRLGDSPNAMRKLTSIYQDCLDSDPRKSILAGRVLGRKIDAGSQKMIHAQTSMIMFGIQVAFTPCVCGHCDKLNVGIPVPEKGLYIGFYGQEDDKKGVYPLPVLCDYCGKEFFIAWDEDPR